MRRMLRLIAVALLPRWPGVSKPQSGLRPAHHSAGRQRSQSRHQPGLSPASQAGICPRDRNDADNLVRLRLRDRGVESLCGDHRSGAANGAGAIPSAQAGQPRFIRASLGDVRRTRGICRSRNSRPRPPPNACCASIASGIARRKARSPRGWAGKPSPSVKGESVSRKAWIVAVMLALLFAGLLACGLSQRRRGVRAPERLREFLLLLSARPMTARGAVQ